MKKVLVLLLSLTLVVSLSACDLFFGEEREIPQPDVPDEFPEEEIEIDIWHAWGDDNQALLDDVIESYNEIYPNVTVDHLPQGGYDGLRESTVQGIVGDNTPDLVMGYPDHFVEYLTGNALVPLDAFIEHEKWSIDEDDFIDGFMAENQQYEDYQFSMPLNKSTEMVVYNKTVFDHFGYDFGLDTILTFDEIEDIAEDLEWTQDDIDAIVENPNANPFGGTEHHPDDIPHILNFDSAANTFIVHAHQWEGGYTDEDGNILVEDDNTIAMLEYFNDMFDRNILTFPIEWDENYGSIPFKDGRVLMSQGSTAGTRHNIPDQEDGAFGIFEMGIMPAVQKNEEGEGPRVTMQQGPNIAIMADTTDNERIAAWEFIRHMTNPENSAIFAIETGYVPVRESSYDLDFYQEFLELGEENRSDILADIETLEDELDDLDEDSDEYDEKLEELNARYDDLDNHPFAMANAAAQAQTDYFNFDPAFVGRVSSSRARSQADAAFEAIYAGTRTVDEAVQRMLEQLGVD